MLHVHRCTAKHILTLPVRTNGSKLKKYKISRTFTSIKPPPKIPERTFVTGVLVKWLPPAIIAAFLGGFGMYMYSGRGAKEIHEAFDKLRSLIYVRDEKEKIKKISGMENRVLPPVKGSEEGNKLQIEITHPGKSENTSSKLKQKEIVESGSNEQQIAEKSTGDVSTAPVQTSEREASTLSEVKLSPETNEITIQEKEKEQPEKSPAEIDSKASDSADKPVATDVTHRKDEVRVTPDPGEENLLSTSATEEKQTGEKASEHVKHMEEYAQARTEEALSSDFPNVHGNTEPTESGAEQLRTRAEREYNKFIERKNRLSENIKSQVQETERVGENPHNMVANQSLFALEATQLEYEAELGVCKEHALASLQQLRESDETSARKYENLILSAQDDVSRSLKTLSGRKSDLQRREVSDEETLKHYKEKISQLNKEVSSLQQRMSQLKRDSDDSQEDLDRKYSDMLSATKKMMYQLIVAHHDHMATRLAEHTGKLNSEWARIMERELGQVRSKHQQEKSGVLARIEGIARGLGESEESLIKLKDFQLVRSLVDELLEFIDGKRDSRLPRMFTRQKVLALIEHLKDRPDVSGLLKHIPPAVLVHGLTSKAYLMERFRKVERSCWRLAYVQDEQKLGSYVSSYLRSLLTPHWTPDADFPRDLEQRSVSNVAMLKHAHKCVQKGDLYNTALLMNNLRGVARTEAGGWVREAVSYLETEQVILVLYWYLNAHAVAAVK